MTLEFQDVALDTKRRKTKRDRMMMQKTENHTKISILDTVKCFKIHNVSFANLRL